MWTPKVKQLAVKFTKSSKENNYIIRFPFSSLFRGSCWTFSYLTILTFCLPPKKQPNSQALEHSDIESTPSLFLTGVIISKTNPNFMHYSITNWQRATNSLKKSTPLKRNFWHQPFWICNPPKKWYFLKNWITNPFFLHPSFWNASGFFVSNFHLPIRPLKHPRRWFRCDKAAAEALAACWLQEALKAASSDRLGGQVVG